MTATQISATLRAARRANLAAGALHLLCLIADGDIHQMTRLSNEIGISTSAMTGLADGLAAHKLITRAHGVSDRRSVYIKITPLGSATLTTLIARATALAS